MVSRVAKVNCTDVLIVLWAWHLVATPGRAKQAKVKSASLVKALLTTHPQGEEAWGSFLALRGPTFWPAFPGGAPVARHSATHPRSAHLRPPRPAAPRLLQGVSSLPQHSGVPPSLAPKFGSVFRVSFATSDRFQIFEGEWWNWGCGGGGGNTPHTLVLESGNKNFRRAFCEDLAYTIIINIVQVCSLFAP